VIFINTDLDKYIPPEYEVALFQVVYCMPVWPSCIVSEDPTLDSDKQV